MGVPGGLLHHMGRQLLTGASSVDEWHGSLTPSRYFVGSRRVVERPGSRDLEVIIAASSTRMAGSKRHRPKRRRISVTSTPFRVRIAATDGPVKDPERGP